MTKNFNIVKGENDFIMDRNFSIRISSSSNRFTYQIKTSGKYVKINSTYLPFDV